MSEADSPFPDDQLGQLDADPALASAVLELEEHASKSGWDRQASLFALVDTGTLIASEPGLAALMGLDESDAGSLTPVEQEIPADQPLEQVLEGIAWPPEVSGCAVIVERLVLPPSADGQVPDDAAAAQAYAAEHPDRQEVRIVAGATRAGSTYCAMRLRAHDDPGSVVGGIDLVPGLVAALKATLEEEN